MSIELCTHSHRVRRPCDESRYGENATEDTAKCTACIENRTKATSHDWDPILIPRILEAEGRLHLLPVIRQLLEPKCLTRRLNVPSSHDALCGCQPSYASTANLQLSRRVLSRLATSGSNAALPRASGIRNSTYRNTALIQQ
jgi:hypothetical protein